MLPHQSPRPWQRFSSKSELFGAETVHIFGPPSESFFLFDPSAQRSVGAPVELPPPTCAQAPAILGDVGLPHASGLSRGPLGSARNSALGVCGRPLWGVSGVCPGRLAGSQKLRNSVRQKWSLFGRHCPVDVGGEEKLAAAPACGQMPWTRATSLEQSCSRAGRRFRPNLGKAWLIWGKVGPSLTKLGQHRSNFDPALSRLGLVWSKSASAREHHSKHALGRVLSGNEFGGIFGASVQRPVQMGSLAHI